MTLLQRFTQKQALWSLFCEWGVIVLIIVSIVWRGGKSLDMTWVLTGVAVLTTIVAHIGRSKDEKDSVPRYLWVAVIAFIALTVLSFLFSQTKNYGFDELLQTGSLSLLLLWIIRKINSANKEQTSEYKMRVLRVFGLTVVGACVLGILVYVFQPVNRFVGTFFDYRFQTDYWPNAWAQFLLLAWPIVLFLALKDFAFDEKKSGSRIQLLLRTLVVGFVIGCLFLSYSRGAILVFFAQLLLWAAIVFKKTRPHFPIRRVVPIGFLTTVVALSTFMGVNAMRSNVYDVQDVGEKVTFTASEGTSSVSERTQFWVQSAKLAAKKPVLGWGPYSFRFVQPQLQRHVLATSDHPHNVFLKILMERGVLAALVFSIVVLFVLYRSTVVLLDEQAELESLMFSLHMFLLLGTVGVLLHNMIDFNLQFIGIALPFWLCFGMLFTYSHDTSFKPISANVARGTEVLIALLLLIAATYEGGYLVVSSLGRHAEQAGQSTVALKWYGRSGGEIFTRDLQLSRAKLYFQDSEYEAARTAIDAYMKRNSQDYRAWKRLGDISLLDGYKQNALDAYLTAYERGKYNDLGVLRGILETYQAMDNKEAIENMRPEIDGLLTEYAAAIQANAHYIALSPNVEELISVANTLSRLFPDEAPRYQVMAAKADHHAQIERERIESRPPGFLW